MLKRAHWLGAASAAAFLTWGVAPFFAGGCQRTCSTNADCSDSTYCSTSVGTCLTPQAVGFCIDVPTSCPDVIQPVCGCDGKQYQNTCEAAKARESISSNAACSVACGGPSQLTCTDAKTYCHFNDGVCGLGNASGTCDPVPDSCTDATPLDVCGCDGKTYASLCEAQKAGTSILSTGPCPCGGINNTPCESGKYCQFAVGACTQPNPSGTCVAIPTGTCSAFTQPVCGCDGKTYANACEAAKAKESLATSGLCPCGGAFGATCQADEFCSYNPLDGCLDFGATGSCVPRPTSCPTLTDPVCGCDGTTYDNSCEAAKAGTAVALNGACQ